MKILLANPPCRVALGNGFERAFVRAGSRWPFSTVVPQGAPLEYLPFPFYLAYTAALLEKDGHQVLVNDALTLNRSQEQFVEETAAQQPDLLLYEATTPTAKYDLDLARELKDKLPRTLIALAGPHVTTFPRETLQENSGVDFVFQREYELGFTKLVKRLEEGGRLDDVPGLGWREGVEIRLNPPQPIEPLDLLPFPARHLFPSNEKPGPTLYWDGFCQYKPAIQMHATRGCPFLCNFCLWNTVMYANGKYRMFDVARTVQEMKECQEKYGTREIYFDDDTFTANKQHVLDLCNEIKKQKLKINWSVMGDAMVTDEEMIEAMAGAGCIGMKFGVESGDEEILKHIQKPVRFEKLRRFTDWCAKRGIKTHATFTFGLSGETRETMQKTLALAQSLDVDTVQFSMTTPFPGTRYYQEVDKEGMLLTHDWDDFDGNAQSVVKLANLDVAEVRAFCRRASGRWLRHKLLRPAWIGRQLKNMTRLIRGRGFGVIFQRLWRVGQLLRT